MIVALLIKLDSEGPVFYISKRSRKPEQEQKKERWYSYKKGSFIRYYVFRTMVKDASKSVLNLENKYEGGPYIKVENDPRITRVGKFLRKTSIDELPLLWNVLRGDMSLVGIWALPVYEAEHIMNAGLKTDREDGELDLSELARIRFDGRIGLAGYWQSRGRSNLTAEERAIHDSFQTFIQNPKIRDKNFLGDYYKSTGYVHYCKMLWETFKSVVKRTGAI
jgi:lipopolysaccharide/colanic/teichoic acid biosynthesis glycosyltransferase